MEIHAHLNMTEKINSLIFQLTMHLYSCRTKYNCLENGQSKESDNDYKLSTRRNRYLLFDFMCNSFPTVCI